MNTVICLDLHGSCMCECESERELEKEREGGKKSNVLSGANVCDRSRLGGVEHL